MPRLLVTGGAGFIGANFVHYWLKVHPGDRLVVLDALTYAGNIASLDPVQGRPEFRFVHGNVCDTMLVQGLLREETLDTIVHFAAESHVDRAIQGPDAFVHTNVFGTHSMLKAARRVWIEEKAVPRHRFHHVSTDEVYGSLGPGDPPFTETTPYSPNSPYAASKAASDHLVRAYQHTYGLATTISNCSNNYGPYQFPEKLIPLMIVNLLEGRPLPVYGDGNNIRDWLHVGDHCRGLDLILAKGVEGEVYNIGGRSELTNIALVKQLCLIATQSFSESPELLPRFPNSLLASAAESGSLIEFVEDRPGHDRRYGVDCSKIESQLGFKSTIPIVAGLRSAIAWYIAHEDWWRPVMGRSNRPDRGLTRR